MITIVVSKSVVRGGHRVQPELLEVLISVFQILLSVIDKNSQLHVNMETEPSKVKDTCSLKYKFYT